MASSCELLDAELALDRVEAELAHALPPHLRAFAAAYATGRREPAAPEILARATTIEVARRALAHPLLADRGLALLRLGAPVALHVPPRGDYATMIAARDAIAQRRFGMRAIELVHRLHGVIGDAGVVGEPSDALESTRDAVSDAAAGLRGSGAVDVHVSRARARPRSEVPPPPPGWRDPDGHALDPATNWRDLAARHGVHAAVSFVASEQRARTFVIAPHEAIVVIPPRTDSPAGRFAVMHELGHVLAAALSPPGIPRVLDEAIAACVARSPEPIAIAARLRRRALAQHLDAVERGLAPLPVEVPWSLWHDPGAQAAYARAEDLADRLAAAPDLRAAIAMHRDRIDRLPIDI